MRYNEIKLVETRKLFEAATAGLEAQHAIHDIEAISDAVPTMDPQLKASIISNLQNLASKVGDFVAKNIKQTQPAQQAQPQAQPNDPNATVEAVEAVAEVNNEDQEAQAALAKLKADIAAIEASNIDDKIKAGFSASLNETLDKLTKASENITASRDTARSERDEAINFVKEVTGVLVTLGNKVQGFQEDTNTESMTARDRASFKKMAVNAEKFTKTLKQALFGKILDMQEGGAVSGQEIKEFLEACVRGDVINMLQVIGTSQGNIKDHVNPKHQKVFDVFVEENIFSYAPGTTSGAIGPGEMALSMMGNPAEKGKTGDLRIGDEEIEIKASAKTGGRFNSKAIAKATTGWKVWAQKINQIMSQAPEDATISVTQKNGQEELIKAREYNGNRHNVIKGKAKEGSKYNWNASGFKALNIEVLKPYSNLSQTYDLFESSIRALVQNYDKLSKPQQGNSHHKPFNPGDLIEAAINDDGTVDMKKMNIAYSKIAYASYHLADGITTVMLLRTDTLDYTIFKDADELVGQLSSGQAMTGGGFNWNDDQQTPTPGYIAS
jgi:hypothetical protein